MKTTPINFFTFYVCLFFCQSLQADFDEKMQTMSLPQALTIENIICRGNVSINCSEILNKYYQDRGEVVSPSKIEDAKLRISSMSIFRSVSVNLEKGENRGDVIVVFNVQENKSLQWSADFQYRKLKTNLESDKFKSDNNEYSVKSSITDFNFLNSNSYLTLGLNYNITQTNDIDGLYPSYYDHEIVGFESPVFVNNDATSDSNISQLFLFYDDPHLFNSKNWFMTLGFGYSQFQRHVDYRLSGNELTSIDRKNEQDQTYWFYNAEFGYRFASASYIALNTSLHNEELKYTYSGIVKKYDDKNIPRLGFSYGWDSTDNEIFPTKGSRFQFAINSHRAVNSDFNFNSNHISSYSFYSVLMQYKSHHSVSNNHIFSWGFGLDDSSTHHGVLLEYSIISESSFLGAYHSGWKFGVSALNLLDTFESAVSANYIHQTEDFIVRLGISYEINEGVY